MKLNFRRGSAFASEKAREFLKNKKPQDFKKIAVIRHAAIGDWVATRPFLIELKKYFPNAKITLCVDANAIYGMPEDLVDEIFYMYKHKKYDKSKKTSFFERVKNVRELAYQDIIFDLTDSSFTLMMIIFAKAGLKIGYPFRNLRRLFYDVSILRSQYTFESYTHLDMLNVLNYPNIPIPLQYNLSIKTVDKQNPYIIYFAGASMKNRCWSEKNYVNLIKEMILRYPEFNHTILQGIREDEKFLEIYKPFENSSNVILQEALSIDKIYDFLAQAHLVVVGDTGIRNMAIGTNTPTLGIFFNLTPYKYWPRDIKHDCVFNYDLIEPTVDEVYQAVVKHLEKIYKS